MNVNLSPEAILTFYQLGMMIKKDWIDKQNQPPGYAPTDAEVEAGLKADVKRIHDRTAEWERQNPPPPL